MTATNHALTGALIGLIITQPAVAIPAALFSHYALDMIPHFGTGLPEKKAFKTNLFRNYLIIEAFICFWIVLTLFLRQPAHWWLGAICAFVAAAPDLLSFNRFWTIRAGKPYKQGLYGRFASRIQWFERPIGAVIEVVWCAAALFLLAKIV